MSFLTGSVSAVQFSAEWPESLTGQEAELLARFGAEPAVFGEDGESCGWIAGRHRRDTRFGDRNVLGDFLSFDFRRTTDKLPSALVRDYTAEALAELVAGNAEMPPTARQKREARERGQERAEEEAKDGRFQRHAVTPVVWDRKLGRVWFGSVSSAMIDRFVVLMTRTFGVEAVLVTPAVWSNADTAGPATEFVPGVTPMEYAWVPDLGRPDHLGNEFALWLLWRADRDGGEVGKEVAMVARSLALDCPRGQTGSETVRYEGPTRLPEVRRALQAGKLPRQMGLTVVAEGEQYELTLHVDRWAITAGRLPAAGDDLPTDQAQRQVMRLEAVRAMLRAVESLFGTFLAVRRDSEGWTADVLELRGWLGVSRPVPARVATNEQRIG